MRKVRFENAKIAKVYLGGRIEEDRKMPEFIIG